MERANLFEALEIQRDMLSKTGAWPKRQKTTLYRFRQIMSWVCDLTFTSTLFIELRHILVVKDYEHLTEHMSFTSSCASYVIKHMIFVGKAPRVLDTLDRLENPLFKNFPIQSDKHLKNTFRYARIIMRMFQFFVVNLVILYSLKPLFTKDDLPVRFVAYDLGNWRIPYHLYQVVCIGVACWNHSSLDIFAMGLISIGTAQFQVLRDKLLHITEWAGLSYDEVDNGQNKHIDDINDETDKAVNERLKECVKHHLAIIEFAGEIENIYTYYFLVQFFDSVIAICNTWFQIVLADDIFSIAFVITYTAALITQLGIYCFYGNNLMLKSAEIRDACYMSNWYNCGPRVRKTLMIIMERSKRPTVLTAGKFSILSLATYSSLLQSTYSYFAIMKNLYAD